MKVIPLGTNGFFPSYGRQTACYAISYRRILILLDGGSGLFRLGEKEGQMILKGIQEVHLYLSHYHLDHAFGFYAAFELLKKKKVIVLGSSNKRVFSGLAELGYFPVDYRVRHTNFSWKILRTGEQRVADGYTVAVRKQHHGGFGSIAFRFDFGLAYVTDSEPAKESIDFVKGVKLLLHEHYLGGENILKKKRSKLEDHVLEGHVTTVGAALTAKYARVGKLVLIHHYPFADEKKLEKQLKLARSIFPRTQLAQDFKQIRF